MKTEITLSGECGNSPKNAFAEQFAVALLTADSRALAQMLTPDCAAVFPQRRQASGIKAVMAAIADLGTAPQALAITHAITHGRVGAVNGTVLRSDVSAGFALFFDFRNTKADSIAAIRLYYD